MTFSTVRKQTCGYLDGEGVQVIEHHMVWFWQQSRVTLVRGEGWGIQKGEFMLLNELLQCHVPTVTIKSKNRLQHQGATYRDACVLVEQHLQQVRR